MSELLDHDPRKETGPMPLSEQADRAKRMLADFEAEGRMKDETERGMQ